MAKIIRTVCGDISPAQLGMTSMHEHTLFDLRHLTQKFIPMLPPVPPETTTYTLENLAFLRAGGSYYSLDGSHMDDVEYMARELGYFKALGGQSIVDCSPSCLRGDITDIRQISRQAGVNIICSSGLYTDLSRPDAFRGWTEDQMAELFEKETTVGIAGTDIRAGILKCAIEATNATGDDLHPEEKIVVRACARVAGKTGMPMQIHCQKPVTPKILLKTVHMILDEFGVAPGKLLLCHMDNYLLGDLQIFDYVLGFDDFRILSHETHDAVLKLGVNIGIDTWGLPIASPMLMIQDDYDRLKLLYYVLDNGYASQIVVGHDSIGKLSSKQFGGFGMTRWPEYAIGMCRQLGIPEEDLQKVSTENPARILAF